MATQRRHGLKPILLNDEGQQRLEKAFEKRCRQRASFLDIAEGYLVALQDEGLLFKYLHEDIDPFEILEWAAEHGTRP